MDHNYWLATNSGNKIDLVNPENSVFTIEDVANALSKVCRFNGNLDRFYSVATHSMTVASIVPDKYKLQALMHDASEAFLCDIPTPLKRMLGKAYTDIEERMMAAMGKQLGFDPAISDVVHQADAVVTLSEKYALQRKPLDWGDREENLLLPRDYILNNHNNIDLTASMFANLYARYLKLT